MGIPVWLLAVILLVIVALVVALTIWAVSHKTKAIGAAMPEK